jgi:CBS domain containing-hemolysin-like protein
VFGLFWERVAGLSVVLLRRQNERLVAGDRRQPPRARSVEQRHLTALSLDMLRGVIMSLVGAVLGTALLRALAPFWLPGATVAAGLLTVALMGLVAACLPLMGGFRERRLVFAAGLICGVALLLLT